MTPPPIPDEVWHQLGDLASSQVSLQQAVAAILKTVGVQGKQTLLLARDLGNQTVVTTGNNTDKQTLALLDKLLALGIWTTPAPRPPQT